MIYLASASPRRQELLHQLGIAFEVMPANLDEIRGTNETPTQYVTRVARDKAAHIARAVPNLDAAVLGADTEVVLDDEVFGKPRDRNHGLEMLQRLQGRVHEVLTAVVLIYRGHEYMDISRSSVTIAPMTAVEIDRYWDTGEPVGKAGGYAVQGRGAAFIARIDGSYSGVMGLPLFELTQLFKKAGLV
jgi:septum formation protein